MVLKENSILKIQPELYNIWDFKLNEELGLNIFEMTKGQHIIAYWKCVNGHSYPCSIYNKIKNKGCPYCCLNPKVLIGFNDLHTTNPIISSMLLNKEDGYNNTKNSNQRVDWICFECGNKVSNRSISKVNKQGLRCAKCNDGISFAEKVMYHLLMQSNIEFKYDSSFIWSNKRRYDFYLPKYNMIIEMHGRQHYQKVHGRKDLREVQQNDHYKYKLALSNCISNYLVVDCRESDFEFIKNNILNTELNKIIHKDVDWESVYSNSLKSFIIMACELWNEGNSTVEISNKLKLIRNTIIKYLKIGAQNNWCSYDTLTELKMAGEIQGKKNNKLIIQLTLDGKEVREWNSLTEASETLGISKGNISSCCTGKRNDAGGFKWIHKHSNK